MLQFILYTNPMLDAPAYYSGLHNPPSPHQSATEITLFEITQDDSQATHLSKRRQFEQVFPIIASQRKGSRLFHPSLHLEEIQCSSKYQ